MATRTVKIVLFIGVPVALVVAGITLVGVLGSQSKNTVPNIVSPTEPAVGCEHIRLDEVLPGIGSDIQYKAYRREQYINDKKLVPGQKVPNFTLATLDGEEVSLTNVLKEHDTVLLDFWTSTCGPCIASFPKLKELRSQYSEDGFEIISIALDAEREDWVDASAEHELPWIELGEQEHFYGKVATLYGVRFIPKSYLVDSEGCLMQKDLPTESLEQVLVSRYDDV